MRHLLMTVFLIAGCADPSIESTTILEDTPNTIGPYEIQSVIHAAHPGDSVELFYNALDNSPERYIPIRMEPIDSDGQAAEHYVGNIPGQPVGSTIYYYVAVERDGSRVSEDPVGGDLNPYEIQILP